MTMVQDIPSLATLFTLPINTIKIDRAFVHSLLDSKASREIIRSTLLLAERLDMKIVCEGVETPEQFNELSSLGCKAFQGYLLARTSNRCLNIPNGIANNNTIPIDSMFFRLNRPFYIHRMPFVAIVLSRSGVAMRGLVSAFSF